MKKALILATAIVIAVFTVQALNVMAATKTPPGEEAFIQFCAVCHAEGGNVINPAKTLKAKDLKANGIKKPADIIAKMRNPGPGMTKFDEKDVPEKTARDIAAYILKTFK